MDPSQPPGGNPYGQPQQPAYGYPQYGQPQPYAQAPVAAAPPQQAYYQAPVAQPFDAMSQAPLAPVYAPPPAPVYVAPPTAAAPPPAPTTAKFGEEVWHTNGSPLVGLDLVRSLTDDTGKVVDHVRAKCVAWLPASVADFFDDDGKPAALYKIRYTDGELSGDHEIQQSIPRPHAAEEDIGSDDSVRSKASKFDPNEEIESDEDSADDDWGGRPAQGPLSAKKRTRGNDVDSESEEDDDGAVAPPSEKKKLRGDGPVEDDVAPVAPMSNDEIAGLAALAAGEDAPVLAPLGAVAPAAVAPAAPAV